MTKFFAQIAYLKLVILGKILVRVPFTLKSWFLALITFLWWDIIRFRRHIVLLNLSLVFTRKREETMNDYRIRLERIGRRSIWHAGYGFIEILERFGWTQDTVQKRVRFHGFEKIKELSGQGKRGFFLLTAHLGSWELAGLAVIGKGIKLAALTRFLRSKFWDEILVRSRERFGLRVLGESHSGRAVVRSVREGYVIAFMMDQHTGEPHGIESEFLGVKAWSPKGLALLSRALKAPVVEGFLIRDECGGYDLFFGEFLPTCAESEPDKDESMALHVKLCNEKMEQWIRRYPEQYLWLHRRFKAVIDYRSPLPWDYRG
jgi:Kdo2-lipid IVA lauroyltransferase/acyltransferase